MTASVTHASTTSRVIHGLPALALAAFLLVTYWPMVQLFDLSRADLQYQGEWIGGNARQVTAVTAGGAADRAGLKPGDVLEFDPAKNDDWVLASYREMPEGFRATLPVRHADGTRSVVTLAPERVAYLPTLNDRLALVARLSGQSIGLLLGLFLVWARPGVMSWAFFLFMAMALPLRPWVDFALASDVGDRLKLLPVLGAVTGMVCAIVPFALSFPRNSMARWPWWLRALGLLAVLAWLSYLATGIDIVPFRVDKWSSDRLFVYAAVVVISVVTAMAILLRSYRRASGDDRARLKWAVLGMSAVMTVQFIAYVFLALPYQLARNLSGSGATPMHWLIGLVYGFFWPLAMGNAILRQRVIDAQFAVSRTLVYGTVSTLALAVVAAVHWLLGRVIEHSGLALGLEGAAAIGVGLVLHRGTHTINGLVDRVVFRKHHAAEERLRRVTAALPFATEQRSIANALVMEPVRNLDLASAALFYRDSQDGPLRRVLAHGWSEEHATSLETDGLLVCYLQAEHEPLKLDDSHLLPADVPEGAALPVLAMPIVNQHVLTAVVLYGAHANHTLLDPDEIELLHALAKAAATSHQQVRIAALAREVATLSSENAVEKARVAQLEASLRVFAQGRVDTSPVEAIQ